MGKALEIVNRFYHLTNKMNMTEGLDELLANNMTFSGPLLQTSSARDYIGMFSQFVKFHKGMEMLRQFESGDDVCSIYRMDLATPSGGTFSVKIADWIRVSNGRIAEQKIYYDPREFARAFGL
jgi:ketosteroid isomerase-like protein